MLNQYYLLVIGILMGSFVNALVWRVHIQSIMGKVNLKSLHSRHKHQVPNISILNGRSMCVSCKHVLTSKDLVPILSWLWLRGRCRYCRVSISKQYPLVELLCGCLFWAIYTYWPKQLVGAEWILFPGYLLSTVGLLALAIYDFKWMLLPSRILYPTALIAILSRLGYIATGESSKLQGLLLYASSLVIASGVFWLFFEISKGEWIGFGDVRLGLITSALLATPQKALLMIFLASVLGLMFMLPKLLVAGNKKHQTKLPYGPFLIASTLIVSLYGENIFSWYSKIIV